MRSEFKVFPPHHLGPELEQCLWMPGTLSFHLPIRESVLYGFIIAGRPLVWEWTNNPGLANQFLPGEFSRHFFKRGIAIRRISLLMGGKSLQRNEVNKKKVEPRGEGIIKSRMSHAEGKHTSSDFLVSLFACHFELNFCHLEVKGSRLRRSMWRVVEYKILFLPSPSYIAFPDIWQISGYYMIP